MFVWLGSRLCGQHLYAVLLDSPCKESINCCWDENANYEGWMVCINCCLDEKMESNESNEYKLWIVKTDGRSLLTMRTTKPPVMEGSWRSTYVTVKFPVHFLKAGIQDWFAANEVPLSCLLANSPVHFLAAGIIERFLAKNLLWLFAGEQLSYVFRWNALYALGKSLTPNHFLLGEFLPNSYSMCSRKLYKGKIEGFWISILPKSAMLNGQFALSDNSPHSEDPMAVNNLSKCS